MSTERSTLPKPIRKYLEQHAEPEASCAQGIAEQAGRAYAGVAVIPAYGEDERLRATLATVPRCNAGRVLIVLVINERDDSPGWAVSANRDFLSWLRSGSDPHTGAVIPLDSGVAFLKRKDFDIVVVDRTTPGNRLPSRQGVGLARKIGADLALALGAIGACHSPWIHCTDADVLLPVDYFDRLEADADRTRNRTKSKNQSARLYDFRHDVNDSIDDGRTIREYELFLRYYVLGLRSAGSPYAFHTIGSTLAIDANAYAAVRGFPKREAAEDFHLLAKLAKVGNVLPLRGDPIVLSGRQSERVPFGTGRAMIEGLRRETRGETFSVYDPRCFEWLRVWLETLAKTAQAPGRPIEEHLDDSAGGTDVDPAQLRELADRLGALAATRNLLQKKGDIPRSLNESFDALATLKFVHAVRDAVHPDIPLPLALARAPFLDLPEGANLEEQLAHLTAVEKAAN